MKILVTGADSIMGSELKEIAKITDRHSFVFVDIDSPDFASKKEIEEYFSQNEFDFCVNCAAYIMVDGAEENLDLAKKLNIIDVENLAFSCKQHDVILIHLSSNYLFDGEKNLSYSEKDLTSPVNIYGKTRLQGENKVQNIAEKYFIIRSSWMFSSFGINFVKTMLRISSSRDSIDVVDDQLGTPTYAKDLADLILLIIDSKKYEYGVYHYSNEGVASWFDFAQAIFEYADVKIELNPILTEAYPFPAKRPVYTVLNKKKIKDTFKIKIPHWRVSLKKCIRLLD